MLPLSHKRCVACRADAPKVTASEAEVFLKEIPDWVLAADDDVPKLTRSYHFNNYRESVAFANKVAELANEENHHPRIVLEYREVVVQWWTHKISHVHENDFIMAAKCDHAFTSGK